jgi:hypothetical protein
MSRHFPDWLEAYENYARDAYCPDAFHRWTGLSVLSGALERKVWLKNGKITFFPNIFVFLVTYAGVGKTTALVRGTDLLERLKEEINPEFKIIDDQVTEPAFVKLMSITQAMQLSATQVLQHSSGFFHASEASSSALQNTHGNFIATVTGFYDCPRVFRKTTLSGGSLEFRNVCFSMLAGATFDYLKNLVNETSVMGGFASRVMYVVNKERMIREPKWGASSFEDTETQDKLFQDLCEIHRLQGHFTPSPGFVKAWEDFQPESDRLLIGLNSPRLESLAARRSNHVTKVAMLLSIAESNNLNLERRHWDRALEYVEDVMKDNAFILSQGAMADKMSQSGITQTIGHILKKNGGKLQMTMLKRFAMSGGSPVDNITKTIDYMLSAAWIKYDTSSGLVELLVDPDGYL